MMFWDHGLTMGWMAIWSLLSLIVFFGALWIAARFLWAPGGPSFESPEAILKRRYASGEINREEYERRLTDIRK
jgi:uncharacterized membrane protein